MTDLDDVKDINDSNIDYKLTSKNESTIFWTTLIIHVSGAPSMLSTTSLAGTPTMMPASLLISIVS